ncbi:lactonase family protein [Flexithrix dorotheae]|uniref:lactonase family protein n=1 Tax=Flexithrix dorotheae TaxID=70993 RepID=UPI0003656F32|nr:beta-propeller fold lactonase family protein [Flexithrix dorotheae]
MLTNWKLIILCFALFSCGKNDKSNQSIEEKSTEIPAEDYLQVLVTVKPEGKIIPFQLFTGSGKLTQQEPFKIEGGPATLFLKKNKKELYAGLRDVNSVALLSFSASGQIQVKNTFPLGFNPVHLVLDPTEKYLWAASYSDNTWAVFAVNAEGVVSPEPISKIEALSKAHQIVVREKENWVMVPALGMNALYVYDREKAISGTLEKPIQKLEFSEGTGPRHLVWHPTKPMVFVAGELNSTVATILVNEETGLLELKSQVSSLPEGFTAKNTLAQIKVSADGKQVYTSNRGHNSIAVYDILDESPWLKLKQNIAAPPIPRAFEMDPNSRWLLAAGQESGEMMLYKRDESSGLLTLKETVFVGKQSFWVEIF